MGKFFNLRNLPFVVGFAERLTLVVGVFALTERDFHFGETFVVDEELQRDDGFAGVLGGFGEFAYLAFVEQQFAVAFGGMVGIGTETVLGDMHLLDEDLPILYRTITIHQRGFAFTNGLDLRSVEDNAGCVAIEDDILKLRLLVQDPYFAL